MTRARLALVAPLLLGIAAQGCFYLRYARDFDLGELRKGFPEDWGAAARLTLVVIPEGGSP